MDVFKFVVIRNPKLGSPRTVYQGWHRLQDIPRPIVTLTVFPGAMLGYFVEWVETSEDYRLQGFARELWEGIESRIKSSLTGEGVTRSGKAFVEALLKIGEGTVNNGRGA